MATNQDQNKGRQSNESTGGKTPMEQKGRSGETEKTAGTKRDQEEERKQGTKPGQPDKDMLNEEDEDRRSQKGNQSKR